VIIIIVFLAIYIPTLFIMAWKGKDIIRYILNKYYKIRRRSSVRRIEEALKEYGKYEEKPEEKTYEGDE